MKKKIAIVTWCTWQNFGTFLQAYALQHIINSLGFQCKILDDESLVKIATGRKRHIKAFIKSVLPTYSHYIKAQSAIERCYHEFKAKYLQVDYDVSKYKDVSHRYDAFICGSDQIWNPGGLVDEKNRWYFANFTDKYKIAYAPSIGINYIPEDKKELFKQLICNFKHLSVREPQGQKAMQELVDTPVALTVDPTLLLPEEEWIKITPPPLEETRRKYLLAYFLTYNPHYIEETLQYAKKHGLQVVAFYVHREYRSWADKLLAVGPLEFLSAIKHAECVFTDSFHGTIFSTIFERQFMLFKRFDETNSVLNQNSRIFHLMSMMGLVDRIIDKDNLDKIYTLPAVEFDKVKLSMAPFVESSMEYLKNALDEIE